MRSDPRSRLEHERAVARLRPKVLKRDGWRCSQCEAYDRTGRILQIDHIVPWADGGPAEMGNLRTLCIPCHRAKTRSDLQKPGLGATNPMR